MTAEDTVRSLREALDLSPDNIPLRRHLASVLLGLGRADEAEAELRDALRRAPHDADVKLELGAAYRSQGKMSAAHVIFEDMIRHDVETARARVERARTFLAEGEVEQAVRDYRRALDEDPEIDPELGETLGVKSPDAWSEVVEGKVREPAAEAAPHTELEPVDSDIDFSHVGGMGELKADIRRKIIQPLQHPELYQAYGKAAGGGILLYGPPGCGKTHLARATAGEVQAKFLAVGIHEILDMWIGQSERNLHEIFELARMNRPCVLFFDEADALGASRSDLRASAGRQTINQFLAELDGVQERQQGRVVSRRDQRAVADGSGLPPPGPL